MSKLKPCPFCGKPAYLDSVFPSLFGIQEWIIRCPTYGCFCNTNELPMDKIGKVIAWNTRPIEDELRAELEKTIDNFEIYVMQTGEETNLLRAENELLREFSANVESEANDG